MKFLASFISKKKASEPGLKTLSNIDILFSK
jgi:hypothetical protein